LNVVAARPVERGQVRVHRGARPADGANRGVANLCLSISILRGRAEDERGGDQRYAPNFIRSSIELHQRLLFANYNFVSMRESLAITSLETHCPNARIRRRGSFRKTLVQRAARSPLGLADRFCPHFAVAKLTPHYRSRTDGT
jgi:hypothetical protein